MMRIDGKKIAEAIKSQVAQKISSSDVRPGLAALLVGHDPASELYVGLKQRACEEVGIAFELHRLDETASGAEVIATIESLNKDKNVHAILLQLPLPSHLDENEIIARIDPKKDVDGFHPANRNKFLAGDPVHAPIMVEAIFVLIGQTSATLKNAHVVILGNSEVFVEPLRFACERAGAHVTAFAPTPAEIPDATVNADIMITALGRPQAINASHIKDGAVVIDIGINKLSDGSIVGDIDADSLAEKSVYLTPVPGGVGPVTVACLLQATYDLATKE